MERKSALAVSLIAASAVLAGCSSGSHGDGTSGRGGTTAGSSGGSPDTGGSAGKGFGGAAGSGNSGGLLAGTGGRPSTGGSVGTSLGGAAGSVNGGAGGGAGGAGGKGSAGGGGTAVSVGGSTGGGSGGTVGMGTGGGGGMPSVPETPNISGTCSGGSGTLNFETSEFCVSLAKDSQTVAALKPKGVSSFDFTPSDLLSSRSGAGYFQLGDITLRVRSGSSGAWQNVTTSSSRTAVSPQPASGNVLAAADLAPALPAGFPLSVTRSWVKEGGRLVMRFVLKNTSTSPVQVGAFGIPMIFNNVITNRTLDQAHAQCSFADPYIGEDAGYLQVTRLSGQGPALLVLPDGKTPFEAYNPILNAPKTGSKDPVAVFTEKTARGQTFEGFLEWMVHSKAYADGEWAKAAPWNPATDLTLAAGESKTYGVVFVLSDTIRNIEKTLAKYLRPVAVGIPGYIIPQDLAGKLYLKYPAAVSSIAVEPANALTFTPESDTASGYKAYAVAGKTWGRARATVTYGDGTVQTIHYYVTKPAAQAIADMGTFLTTKAWYAEASDPFGRSPSVMTYDHDLGKIVTQWQEAWVCGLGDDGGATWLAGAMKQFAQPDAGQVSKYQDFVDKVIWGGLQYSTGTQQYGVKRTLFYYEPSTMPAGTYDSSVQWNDPTTNQVFWGAWNKAHTLEVPRSYNYPHVAALYWAMYRLARNHTGLVSNHTADWYLNQAYKTAVTMTTIGNDYAQYGLMDGTIFIEILKDLQREGKSTEASDLESKMKARADAWNKEAYPFASEMAWDSTGQEEVYGWTRYFKYTAKAKVCVDAITGYMPAIPHWGYNGCARRYWDFEYGGSKTTRIERMIHHYGSSLNAIPMLTEFRDHPDDIHLLRIGYAGMMGSLSNIDQDGFPSMAFHTFPDTMKWDGVTGDYGLNFFGHAYGSGTYVVNHPDFGWQAFGGTLSASGTTISVTPLDSMRRRIYIAAFGLWLTLDAGQFQKVDFDSQAKSVQITLAPSDANTPAARLRVEQPASISGVGTFAPATSLTKERDAYVITLGSSATTVSLTSK
jgi:hypothetical protein